MSRAMIGSHAMRRGPLRAGATFVALAGAVLLCVAPGAATASGSVSAGQEKSATCAACHGAQGESAGPQWPILAGQYSSYLEHSLKAYRSGSRQNAIMQGFAGQLSDQDIEDLAAYFAAQTGPLQTAPRGY